MRRRAVARPAHDCRSSTSTRRPARPRCAYEDTDPIWLEIVPGRARAGPATRSSASADRRRLAAARRRRRAGHARRAPGPRGAGRSTTTACCSPASEEPTEIHLWWWRPDGALERLTDGRGVHGGVRRGGGHAGRDLAADLDRSASTVDGAPRRRRSVATIASHAEHAVAHAAASRCTPVGERRAAGPRSCSRPAYDPADGPLPVLHAPVRRPARPDGRSPRRAPYLTIQWFADQGFAVVIIDGRGTPGRGSAWERAIADDLATTVLEDQVDGLLALAKEHPELDLDRVGDHGLVVRRLPRRARRAAPAGRVPRRGRRRAGHRLAALRHALHRALPRPPGRAPGEVRRDLAARPRPARWSGR